MRESLGGKPIGAMKVKVTLVADMGSRPASAGRAHHSPVLTACSGAEEERTG